MVLELHVWGPAFSLPSLDAECLAAIAYMNIIAPAGYGRAKNSGLERERVWTIVPSSNPALSPTGTLPALRDTRRNKWVGGFEGVVDYLTELWGRRCHLDTVLEQAEDEGDEEVIDELEGSQYEFIGGTKKTEQKRKRGGKGLQWAESVAFRAFVRRRVGALVEGSLWVSRMNYEGVTRGILATLVGWPAGYWVPGWRREVARGWVKSCGLEEAVIDPAVMGREREEEEEEEAARRIVGFPSGQTKEGFEDRLKKRPKIWVSRVMFRMKEMVERVISPVAVRILENNDTIAEQEGEDGTYGGLDGCSDGPKTYFFGGVTRPTSLDCLIFSYLALAIYPSCPPSPLPYTSVNISSSSLGKQQDEKAKEQQLPQILPNSSLYEAIKELDSERGGRNLILWVEQFRRKVFGPDPIDPERILAGNPPSNSNLPWAKPEKADLPWLTGMLLKAIKQEYVEPLLLNVWFGKKEEKNGGKAIDEKEKERREKMEKALRRDRWEKISSVVLGVGAFVGYLFWSGAIKVVEVGDEDGGDEGEEEENDPEEGGVKLENVNAEELLGAFADNKRREREEEKATQMKGKEDVEADRKEKEHVGEKSEIGKAELRTQVEI